jgi:CRISPR/Cas system CSM-associated protein Csm4 (group 5 of RAMP superfamily)
MVRTSFAEKKQKKRKQKKWKRMKKIRLKQYASLRLKERHNNYECLNQSQGKYLDLIPSQVILVSDWPIFKNLLL